MLSPLSLWLSNSLWVWVPVVTVCLCGFGVLVLAYDSKSLLVYISRYSLPSVCNSLQFGGPSCSPLSLWLKLPFLFASSFSLSLLLSVSPSLDACLLFHIWLNTPPSLHIYFWCLSLSLHANITSPCFLITTTPYNTHTHPWVSCVSVSHRCMISPLFAFYPVVE